MPNRLFIIAALLAACSLVYAQQVVVEFSSCPDSSTKLTFSHKYYPDPTKQSVRYMATIIDVKNTSQPPIQSIEELEGPCKVIDSRNWSCGGEWLTNKLVNRKYQVINGVFSYASPRRIDKVPSCDVLWKQVK
jgi:hypothetical protein